MRSQISECAPVRFMPQTVRAPMPREPSYYRLSELARLCWRQAHMTQDQAVARLLHKMACEFQEAAAKLDSGKLPALSHAQDDKPCV
jgi:hypothetical protein